MELEVPGFGTSALLPVGFHVVLRPPSILDLSCRPLWPRWSYLYTPAPKPRLLCAGCKVIRLISALGAVQAGVAAIAAEARKKGVGARGLRSIMERLLLDAMFHVSHG